jgi:N-acetylated-alpha-linked acidic dipeptidase
MLMLVCRTIPNSRSAIDASRHFAGKPHMAGTSGDLATAEDFLVVLQRELGIPEPEIQPVFSAGTEESRSATLTVQNLTKPAAWIDVYYPVLNSPLSSSLEILEADGQVAWTAKLEEVVDELDNDAWTYKDAVPSWHGLSFDGEAEGKLIYVNYGRKEDYDALVAKGKPSNPQVLCQQFSTCFIGVNFTGSIVLARYGRNFRGLKVRCILKAVI